jgi:CheY-like chemotaxis protein
MAKTILIVDDDPNILDTAKDILEDAGYGVRDAGTGAGALQILKSSAIDLAVLDLHLPDANGVEVAVQAKRISPKIGTILLTGEGDLDLGPAKDSVDVVLTKPVSPARLLEIIQQIVDS